MIDKDVPQVHKLLKDYLKQYQVKLKLNAQEVAHLLLPREKVVYTYVVEDKEQKRITDFYSFYSLPSSVLKKKGHNYDHVNVNVNHNWYRLHTLSITCVQ